MILALAALLSGASILFRPAGLGWDAEELELDLVSALQLEQALWVDARTDADFSAAYFAGAISLNEEAWEEGFLSLLEVWSPGSPIVVYCSSASCLRSHQVARRLRDELDFLEIYALTGGWDAMRAAGLVEGGGL